MARLLAQKESKDKGTKKCYTMLPRLQIAKCAGSSIYIIREDCQNPPLVSSGLTTSTCYMCTTWVLGLPKTSFVHSPSLADPDPSETTKRRAPKRVSSPSTFQTTVCARRRTEKDRALSFARSGLQVENTIQPG